MILDDLDLHRERLMARVVEGDDGCLIWTGGTIGTGYGSLRVKGRHWLAHRLALALIGRSPEVAHHSCHEPRCVNPDHLVDETRAGHPVEHAGERRSCPHGDSQMNDCSTCRARRKSPCLDCAVPCWGARCQSCHLVIARAAISR